MARIILPILFLSCCFYYACNDDCTVLIVDRQPIEPTNPCVNVNPVACNFEFRKGKWLEIQDSISASVVNADTIWFKQDSLIGWSFQGESYLDLTGYFIDNYLYSQPWNSGGQGPVSNIAPYTSYNDTTGVLTIDWLGGLQTIDYYKVD